MGQEAPVDSVPEQACQLPLEPITQLPSVEAAQELMRRVELVAATPYLARLLVLVAVVVDIPLEPQQD